MALTNKREEAICRKYRAYDETDHVHCSECPLRKSQGNYDFRCKANSHYNRHTKEWEYDETVIDSEKQKEYEAHDTAVIIIRKYQEIEQIVKVWHQDIYAKNFECMAEIAEVVEDETN